MVLSEISHLGFVLTAWTIRAAMICLALVLLMRLRRSDLETNALGDADQSAAEPAKLAYPVLASYIWLFGSLCALFHAFFAMGFYHQWSHDLAIEDTAQKTDSLLGLSFGAGIYFNYVFVVIWLLDAIWWIVNSNHYESRSSWITWMIYGYLIFIAINGAIVFETGPVRRFGIAVLILFGILLATLVRLDRSQIVK